MCTSMLSTALKMVHHSHFCTKSIIGSHSHFSSASLCVNASPVEQFVKFLLLANFRLLPWTARRVDGTEQVRIDILAALLEVVVEISRANHLVAVEQHKKCEEIEQVRNPSTKLPVTGFYSERRVGIIRRTTATFQSKSRKYLIHAQSRYMSLTMVVSTQTSVRTNPCLLHQSSH